MRSDSEDLDNLLDGPDTTAEAADNIEAETVCTDASIAYRLATTAAVDVLVRAGAVPPSLLLSDGSRATYERRDTDGALLFTRRHAAGSDDRPVVVDLDPGTSRLVPARPASPFRPAVLAAGGPSASFVMVDLNGNGIADLVGASPYLRGVTVRSGTAGGVFAPAVFHPIAARPHALAVTDLTGDGVLDIVTASRVSLSVLIGEADGRFAPAIDIDLPIASVDAIASRALLPIRPAQFHALFAAFISALAPPGDPEREADATLVVGGPVPAQAASEDTRASWPPESEATSASLRTLAEQVIERRLHDPAFSPETLRLALGVSRSQLYRAFEDDNGVAAAIRDARLDRMHRRLTAKGLGPPAPIKEILRDCGFVDAASVSRAFRRRFGVSPRELRGSSPAPERPDPTTLSR